MSETRRGRRPGQSNYTAAQKQHALKVYAERGASEAHQLTGIPMSTLTRWASAAGVRAPVNELSKNLPNVQRTAAEVVSDVQAMTDRAEEAELSEEYDPEELSKMWLDIARLSYAAYTTALLGQADMAAQRLNNCLGTATDKLQLLNGRATSRREEMSSPEDATGRLLSMFEQIKARGPVQLLDAHSVERVPGDHVAEPRVIELTPGEVGPRSILLDAVAPGHADRAPWDVESDG